MAEYDYKSGKKRIEEILDNTLEVIEQDKIPKDGKFTFTNAYYGWVTGIFVDIRDSSTLFSKEDKEEISKMIRSFTSEIIEILRDDDNLREIGIRGDCVYAIFTTPSKEVIYEIFQKSLYINTFLKMLNKLLLDRGFDTINVGIGISTAKELVIKAGRKDVGIYNNVWIGDAATKASNLSSLGDKDGYKKIIMSNITYINIINQMKKNNSTKDVDSWFHKNENNTFGTFYDINIIKNTFNKWIDDGMEDE